MVPLAHYALLLSLLLLTRQLSALHCRSVRNIQYYLPLISANIETCRPLQKISEHQPSKPSGAAPVSSSPRPSFNLLSLLYLTFLADDLPYLLL